MARYRTYKNGITGHRYKGYYIIKGDTKGTFEIWDKDKTVLQDHIYDYDDCEWIIDKTTAQGNEIEILKELCQKEIYQLSNLLVEFIEKKENGDMTADDVSLYQWVEKVRRRKVKNREL